MVYGELRDEVYWWCLNLKKNGFKIESVILLLATWNFAYMRYYMDTFDLNKLKAILDDGAFKYFENMRFETIDLTDKLTKEKILEIYSSLSNLKEIRYVGATKIMHLLNPEVFVMWDSEIIKQYKAKTTPQGYLDFMIEMQRKYLAGEFKDLNLDGQVTIPRAIDLFNLEL